MKTKRNKNHDIDIINEISSMLPKARVAKAHKEAEQEIFHIRLKELRKKMNIKQEDIKSFSQSSISKLESRKDMKISTLLEYLESIGLGIEITVYPQKKHINANEKIILLKK